MAQDDYFRTVWLPLPSTGRLSRQQRLGLVLLRDWTLLADETGRQLPPQEWADRVAAAVDAAVDEADGFIDDPHERGQLALRLIGASAGDSDGDVLARAFQVNEFGVLGLTISIDEVDQTPSWLDPAHGFGPTVDEAAIAAHAEPAVLGTDAVPRYLRLARDGRTGESSWQLLIALAAEDRPDDVKWAETSSRADALLERARNPPLVDDEEHPARQSAQIWLQYLVPVPHSRHLLTLTFCGYGDAGMDNPLAEAGRRVAALTFGKGH
jgi:hypothetical protein